MTDDNNVFTLGGEKFDPSSLEETQNLEPDPEVIALLRNALERAESGYLQEVVMVGSFADGEVAGASAGENTYFDRYQAMFGELSNQALLYRDIYLGPFSAIQLTIEE